MKEICPMGVKEECEKCRWNFGHEKCAIFSMAADLSGLYEEAPKITKLLEYLCKREQG